MSTKPLVAPKGTFHFMAEAVTATDNMEPVSSILFDPYPNSGNNEVEIGFELPYTMNCRLTNIDELRRIVKKWLMVAFGKEL
ncbi:MAG: hypothetical protein H0W62_01095 [Chitinophagales bacterium]|nr:hypothetical protein [Chitinophagales bacterium]